MKIVEAHVNIKNNAIFLLTKHQCIRKGKHNNNPILPVTNVEAKIINDIIKGSNRIFLSTLPKR
ncbi:hypothetical protein B6A42_01470 [Vibrio coralliilyticus]|nr:hypothetical protein B6A42_01470 [Vibrio coralliilyticus]